MMYFYIIQLGEGNKTKSLFYCTTDRSKDSTMFMSDGYLPVPVGTIGTVGTTEEYYKFSLIFPMGLVVKDDVVMVTAGSGDYYSILLKFDLESVIDSCIHNAADLDMDDYNYHIIEVHDDGHETVILY